MLKLIKLTRILIVLFALISCSQVNEKIILFLNIKETDTHFIITPDDELAFSLNDGQKYNLVTFKDGIIEKHGETDNDIFKPFIYKNRVCGLFDRDGDERYQASDGELNALLRDKAVKKIASAPQGNVLLIQYKNDRTVYLLEKGKTKPLPILVFNYKWHNWTINEKEDTVLLSYDDKILLYKVKNKEKKLLQTYLPGEKENIYYDYVPNFV